MTSRLLAGPLPVLKRAARACRRVGRRAVDRILSAIPQPSRALARDAGRFWSRSDRDDRTRELSHWRCEGRWADEDAWQSVGQSHIDMIRRLAAMAEKACKGYWRLSSRQEQIGRFDDVVSTLLAGSPANGTADRSRP